MIKKQNSLRGRLVKQFNQQKTQLLTKLLTIVHPIFIYSVSWKTVSINWQFQRKVGIKEIEFRNRKESPEEVEKFEIKFARTQRGKILRFLMQIVYSLYEAGFVILTNTNMALILSCSSLGRLSLSPVALAARNRHIVLLICGGIKHHSVRRTSLSHFFSPLPLGRLLHTGPWIFISKVRWESSICKKCTKPTSLRCSSLSVQSFGLHSEPRINFDKVILLPGTSDKRTALYFVRERGRYRFEEDGSDMKLGIVRKMKTFDNSEFEFCRWRYGTLKRTFETNLMKCWCQRRLASIEFVRLAGESLIKKCDFLFDLPTVCIHNTAWHMYVYDILKFHWH